MSRNIARLKFSLLEQNPPSNSKDLSAELFHDLRVHRKRKN